MLPELKQAIGQAIFHVELADDKLIFVLPGKVLTVWDSAQYCCESRHMSCDDDLSFYAGSVLQDVEIKDGPDVEDGYGSHDQQFMVVTTSRGQFTVVNHNVHNGYYGGFNLEVVIR